MRCAVAALFLAGALAMDKYSDNFQRIATFPVCSQFDLNCNTDKATAAQDLTASQDGNTLLYSDPLAQSVGFVDITNPSSPRPLGFFQLDAKPIAVATAGPWVLVAVDDSTTTATATTSMQKKGRLIVIQIQSRQLVTSIDLGGQPSDVSVSPDGAFALVAIENERDQSTANGFPPQAPPGFLVAVPIVGHPTAWTTRNIDLSNLNGMRFKEDPEPKSISINSDNLAAITLQENNAIVLVDLHTMNVVRTIDAGFVSVNQVDLTPDQEILHTEFAFNYLREPDGVVWISDKYFVTADEGDLDGGSRGFTVFDSSDGTIMYTSGNLLEHLAASVGHYPELRSGVRGNEPESVSYGYYGGEKLLFIHSERSSVVTVVDISKNYSPKIKHILPAGVSPSGGVAIPKRNLYVAASDVEFHTFGIRSSITIYKKGYSDISYPTLVSMDRPSTSGSPATPIPWGSISGLAADIRDSSYGVALGGTGGRLSSPKGGKSPHQFRASVILFAVMDKFYRKSRILTIQGMDFPSTINSELYLNDTFNWVKTAPLAFPELINGEDNTVNLDLEGIAVSKFGGFWVVSEGTGTAGGDSTDPVKHLNYLLRVAPNGDIMHLVTLPDSVNAMQSSFGFHGVAEGSDDFENVVVVAFGRPWGKELHPRLGAYDQTTRQWTFYYYPLDAPESSPSNSWVAIADLAPLGQGGTFLVLERDNQMGPDAAVKRIYKIDLGLFQPGDLVTKTFVMDVLPSIQDSKGLVPEKFEGMALDSYGDLWIINDNEGVEMNSGETLLLSVMSMDDEPVW